MLDTAEFNQEEVLLQVLDLPLGLSMVISLDTLLELLGLDIAKELKMDLFTISLLDATIQDSGIEERSNAKCDHNITLTLILDFKIENNLKII